MEEPTLGYALNTTDMAATSFIYHQISENSKLKTMLTIPYELPQQLQELVDLPVAGLGLDLSKADFPNITIPQSRTIALGIIDGTNI